jgi:Activator of Hsp90 ATPase homolog 1-like protein
MKAKDFTTSLLVDQSPEEVYQAVINVRGWWSGYYGEIFEGNTTKLGDEFSFRAGDGAHYSKQKLIAVTPNKNVTWLITESNLSFLEKTDEWTGTQVIFNIEKKGNQTLLTFTHEGLTPTIECYNSCAPAWQQYIDNKLLPLIKNSKSFTASIVVNQSSSVAFNAIKDFRAWWSEEIEGATDKLNDVFFYHYKDIHLCKIKLIEVVPDKKLIYQVIENQFNFIQDQTEWVNTKLVFDIATEGGKTKVTFTHEGLTPDYECYHVCNDAWTGYITNSLFNLITTGKGNANPKDKDGFNAELAEKWKLV